MADKGKTDKDKGKEKPKTKDNKPKDPKLEAKEAKAKEKAKEKKAKDAAAAAEAPAAPAPKEAPAPRPPADPRLKVWKKFNGRFLPKGPLRERLKGLKTRWDSGDDHGGVTLDELKALLADWRASRTKRPKAAKA